MKKHILSSIFLLIFLLVPISVFADGSLGDFNFDPKESSHPLDRVNSKGEIIKYEEYSKKSFNLLNETENSKGTGELTPIYVEDLIKKDYSSSLTPAIDKGDTENKISPYVVIGPDGRAIVEDTTEFPFSTITFIQIEWANGRTGRCTGTLISRDRVLTNAHCVVNPQEQMGIRSATVFPGVSDSIGWFGAYNAIDYFVTSNWINTGSVSEDYAVLVLGQSNNRHAGDLAGFAGIRQVNNIIGQEIGIFGYPGDLIERDGAINQYGMRGNITEEDNQVAYYTIDTARGQSGSALLNVNNQVIGVHSSGYTDRNGDPIINGGPKMSNSMFQFVSNSLN
ncbi:trypsin-like serine peptidase [Sutcliffiella cohnii]